MDDLKNLEDVLQMLTAMEEMQMILESQQDEIEKLRMENCGLTEQLDESMNLNEQLTNQIRKLNAQTRKLQVQIAELKS